MIMMDAYTRLAVTILFIIIATISLTSCFADLDHVVCAESEKQALLSFKQGLKVPSNRLSSWDVEDDCCKWAEVVCNNFTGCVHELHLQNPFQNPSDYDDYAIDAEFEAYEKSMLGGEVKPSLLHLKHLSYLDLSENDFGGIPIPTFLGSLTSLQYLNLSEAGFAGTVPHQIGYLSSLRFLSLKDFDLEVENLHWLSGLSTLEVLDLSYVKFQKDAHNWLQVINMLPSLVELHLSDCGLDHIPPLSNVNFTSLAVLDLSENKFDSMIPRWIFSLSSLVSLNLGFTNCEGPIPSGLQNMTSLRELDLSENFLNSSIPNWLYNFRHLESLNLHGNDLRGAISSSIENWTSVVTLDLSYNNLNRTVPRAVGNLCNLRVLDLSGNRIGGDISELFKSLSGCISYALKSLWLDVNQLSGHLTNPLEQFKSLEVLSLQGNSISPVGLGNLCNLRVLDMSRNRIGGDISELFKSLSGCISYSLKTLFLEESKLSGHLTDPLEQFKSLEVLHLRGNSISGPIPASLGNLCNLRILGLSGNRIGGDISELFKSLSGCISYSLKTLVLGESKLFGHLTDPLEQFKSLETLYLGGNSISGPIPASLGKCSSLITLDLGGNQLNGTLPESLGQLSKLERFYIDDNLLEGVVSEVHCANLTSLKGLYASGNRLVLKVSPNWIPPVQLKGIGLGSWNLGPEFPMWLRSLGGLRVVDLSCNGISDSIPNWFWNLSLGLEFLNLSHNHFSGPLPPVSSTVYLLDLSHNAFSGDLFHFLCDRKDELNNVEVLHLEDNLLSGEIPDCWKNWSALNIIQLGNNNLSGKIPGSLGYLLQLRSLFLNNNSLSGW